MPTWWFVRHGQSLAQLEQWDGPDHETPLSPLGEQQADELAPSLADLPIQRVLVSPYLRARQTAERAARLLQHEHVTIEDLRERWMGDEYRKRYFEPQVNRELATWNFRPPGGESILDSAKRAITALSQLDDSQNTIIFAHGRILAGVLTLLDQTDPASGVLPLDNCVAITRELPTGSWQTLLEGLA